jgi:hypothetical protein
MAGPAVKVIIMEYWNIAEDNLEPFLAWYENWFFRSISNCRGHTGMLVNVRAPRAAEAVLGTPPGRRSVISPHPFLSQLGTRTDAMIDFDALLQYEWNVLGLQLLTSKDHLDSIWEEFIAGFVAIRPSWRDEYPDATEPTDVMVAEFFSLVDNHWDVFVETRAPLWSSDT